MTGKLRLIILLCALITSCSLQKPLPELFLFSNLEQQETAIQKIYAMGVDSNKIVIDTTVADGTIEEWAFDGAPILGIPSKYGVSFRKSTKSLSHVTLLLAGKDSSDHAVVIEKIKESFPGYREVKDSLHIGVIYLSSTPKTTSVVSDTYKDSIWKTRIRIY